jgi:hypothetical protein
VLSSPVFANPHSRPASSPPHLRVLSDLCVKTPTSVGHDRPDSSQTSPHSTTVYCLQNGGFCTPNHQNAKSAPLFSMACALFCNYGGGGVYPCTGSKLSPASLPSSLVTRHHTQVLSLHTLPSSFAMERNTTPLFSDGSKLFRGRVFSLFESPCHPRNASLARSDRFSPHPSSKTEHHPPRPRLPNHPEFAIRHIAQQLTGRRAP